MIRAGWDLAFSRRSFPVVTYWSVTPARLAASVILAEKNRSFTTASTVFMSVEFVSGRFLIGPHAADGDLRFEITLAVHRISVHPPQHGNLTDVRKRIRDRPLKDFFRWESKVVVGSETIVRRFQCGEEARSFLFPRKGSRIGPLE